MKTKLSNRERGEIARQLENSMNDGTFIAERYNLDPFTGRELVQEAANEHGIYRCKYCQVWKHENKLMFTKRDMPICLNCWSFGIG